MGIERFPDTLNFIHFTKTLMTINRGCLCLVAVLLAKQWATCKHVKGFDAYCRTSQPRQVNPSMEIHCEKNKTCLLSFVSHSSHPTTAHPDSWTTSFIMTDANQILCYIKSIYLMASLLKIMSRALNGGQTLFPLLWNTSYAIIPLLNSF
jgi:hypothetical protein